MNKNDLLSILESLKNAFESVQPKLSLSEKEKALKDLQKQMEAPGFWDTPEIAQAISQKAAYTESFVKKWTAIAQGIQDFSGLIEIAEEGDLPEIEQGIQDLKERFEKGETELLFDGEYDQNSALISIHTGNGGQDAEDFSQMLYRMYLRWAEKNDFKVQIIDESRSEVGLKSATIEISGIFAYGFLKSEHGVHRLIRLSPFNAKSLRQTSFSRVEVLPVIEQDTDIEIQESDLRIDVFRASGNGGQSVNTTDSAVRITYLPLNISVSCQNEKSQLQNKAAAMKVLKSRLLQLKIEQNAQEIKDIRGDLAENSFGSQIRTYTLQPYKLVKDHRTDTEVGNPDKVFDGDLEPFIQTFLRKK